ncbi:MAG: hypothetical protein Kow0027_06890 [Saprospiraceae bacterium]
MKRILLILIACFAFSWTHAQVLYEDFEGGTADLPWVGINGTYDGVVANPDATGINTSDFVGAFTTDPNSDFPFVIADLPMPADMAANGVLKLKIWSPVAPSKCLLKFEGSGAPVEQFRDITVANQWVEYTFDLTAGASNPTGLTKVLVSFHSFLPGVEETFYWDDLQAVPNTACYETFDDPSDLTWNAFDGVLNTPVANPGPNSVNSSAMCAEYTKSNMHAYSLLLAESATPFDLSVFNQFKLQVYATAPTQVLLKLEGPGGAIEKTKNIGLANAWQEYTFDFSDAAGMTDLNKVIIFFDPGVEESGDTYYFDNLCAVPQGACAGVTPDPDIIDDFECNRNATYVNGWDSLTVVDNPAPSAVNNSAKVGRYADPIGEPWAALLIDYQNALDLSVKNQLQAKIWSPKATQILFKLEGGLSAPKEIWVDVTEANTWVEYNVDFSSEAAANHKKIVIFFNAGQEPEPGDVYYIDDIRFAEASETVLEDFENGAFLPWEPLDQQTVLHGTFEVVANPDPSGVNTSAMVGKYTKGSSAFSTVAAVAPGVIDISQKPQFNVDIWAPAGATGVIMQLESVSQGNKEVERNINTTEAWETVSFDFSDYQSITDWVAMKLIFNPGVAEQGAMFFFDNVTQGQSTVDPCEGVVPVPNIIDDFECQRNYDYGAGGDLLSVVNNPLLTPVNSSTQVGKYEDQPNEPWAALCIEFPDGIDLSVYNQFQIQINAPDAVPVLYKLEGGSSAPVEVWQDITAPNDWEKVSIDFASQAGEDHKRVCIFFNGGNDHAGGVENYYIDNIRWSRESYNGCIDNHEEETSTIANFKYFANGHLEAEGKQFEVVDNPNPSGINTSAKVGEFVKASDGAPWAGMYADLDAPIDFKGNKTAKAKVLMDHIGNFAIKLENSLADPPVAPIELPVENTKTGEWEELTYDFSSVPDDAQYARLTVFFDLLIDPTGVDVTSYFDDIVIGDGNCITTGVFTPVVESMRISPNPVSDLLRIENPGEVAYVEVYNLFGKRVASLWIGTDSSVEVDMSRLAAGVYTLGGFTKDGRLVANAKLIKQ